MSVKAFEEIDFQLEISPQKDKIISRVINHVKVFDVISGKLILNINGFPNEDIQPKFASFTSNGKEFFVIDDKDKVTWWDAESGQLLSEHQIEDSSIYKTSPDKKLIALVHPSDNDDGEIGIYEIRERKFGLVKKIRSPYGIRSAEFINNNNDLLTIGIDLEIISLKTSKMKKFIPEMKSFHKYSISPQRNSILLADKFWSIEKPFLNFNFITSKKKEILIGKQYQDLLYEINSVGFSPTNPNLMFFAGNIVVPKGGILAIYNVKTNKAERIIKNNLEITSAVFSSDGKSIFFQDFSNRVFIVDIKTGMILQKFPNENKNDLSPIGLNNFK